MRDIDYKISQGTKGRKGITLINYVYATDGNR